MANDEERSIKVAPPLLRKEVLEQNPVRYDYIHGYMVNSGFSDEVQQWHKKNPHTKLNFFRDQPDTNKKDDTGNLVFHKLDDVKFLNYMAGSKAFVTTAGFESVCVRVIATAPLQKMKCMTFPNQQHNFLK